MFSRREVLASLAAAPTIALTEVQAQNPFYAGKTLNIIVGSSTGGYYDTAGRTIARHLARFIPGRPNIVVQNQPGAGSLTMTNQLYANGPFDGTVIGASFNGLPTTRAPLKPEF